jgi:hypothetical protein
MPILVLTVKKLSPNEISVKYGTPARFLYPLHPNIEFTRLLIETWMCAKTALNEEIAGNETSQQTTAAQTRSGVARTGI